MTIEDQIQTAPLPLSRKLSINLLYTANWANDILAEALKPHDLSLQQFNVLRILRGQKGKPANLSTINDRMVTKMSNTTRLVDKLIKKEFVVREVCPSNRRKVEILITAKGLESLQKMDEAVATAEDKITAQLNSNELEHLNNLLNTLRTETNN
ncbi:MarR family transcriptional regulator [Dokdonia sinensis]|uniref:MarR family transcriptional regulator n=1 Tax=Dokdonia sinensis TaxID=2479847 RepID=A0A3M0FU26_9FLAO|nr:MarR family transcriptional regulator [Dokdonia sinensis]RMB56184.1 MarR family transcriptional regulator [Dokdonia sinensis]